MILVYLLFKQCVSSICCCCLLPLLLTKRLKATLKVFFLFVKSFSPSLHVFSDLQINRKMSARRFLLKQGYISKNKTSCNRLEEFIIIPAEQSCFWAFPFSPWVLCCLLLHCLFVLLNQLSQVHRFASHCPSIDTVVFGGCSNTDNTKHKHRI